MLDLLDNAENIVITKMRTIPDYQDEKNVAFIELFTEQSITRTNIKSSNSAWGCRDLVWLLVPMLLQNDTLTTDR